MRFTPTWNAFERSAAVIWNEPGRPCAANADRPVTIAIVLAIAWLC